MQWLTKERNQKVIRSLVNNLPKPGMLGASPHHGRQTPKCPSTLLDRNSTQKSRAGFLDSSKNLRRHQLLHNTLMSRDKQISTHPGMPFVTSNRTFTLNKTFILWILINSDKRLAVSGSWNPGTSALNREGVVSTWH